MRYNQLMRSALALALSAIFTAGAVGCTFLVSFDDLPDAGAAIGDDDDDFDAGRRSSSSSSSGTDTSSSSGDTSSSSSSSSSSSGNVYPPACDKSNLGAANCAGKADGFYCGLAGADDLTQCEGETPVCIFHCTMGCADNPGAIPDQCAKCDKPGENEIWVCGKDADWVTAARDVAYACSNGKVVNGKAPGGDNSPGTCGLKLCHSKCTRTNPPPLNGACCQGTPEE